MKIEIISREIIKPSSPTPIHLKTYNFSLFDHLFPTMFIPIILFYPKKNFDNNIAHQINLLKRSLSNLLSRYYPFAGRFRDSVSINCNDEGVELLLVRVNCTLDEILKHPNFETLDLFFPNNLQWKDSYMVSSLVVVQITIFACGRMGIGVCVSHKIADVATICNFMKDWASLALDNKQDENEKFTDQFIGASLFPRENIPTRPQNDFVKSNCISKRFVFNASKIEALKTLATDTVKNPTRVEVVTSFIYKCATLASRKKLGSLKPNVLVQVVNLRKRMEPPLSEKMAGNIAWFYSIWTSNKTEGSLQNLVMQMREEMMNFCNNYAKKFRGEEGFSLILDCLMKLGEVFRAINHDVYRFTSWCKFGIYEVDFGWGNPIWVTTTSSNNIKNTTILMDNKDDGIEALVTLDGDHMGAFECCEEFLEFASFNPSVLD